ncbi:MAG: hypothetical protein AB2814_12295, partial [Candidatus Sedimenticola endophacoides]
MPLIDKTSKTPIGYWLFSLTLLYSCVTIHHTKSKQECRYLVKDFGTSQSPKSTRQRDSRYCPD